MWAKGKIIFNNWQHGHPMIYSTSFFIRLACTAVDYQRVKFSTFFQVVMYICDFFFWSCLKDIIWTIFVFNWIFFWEFHEILSETWDTLGHYKIWAGKHWPREWLLNSDSCWVNRLSHLTSINLIFLICKTKLSADLLHGSGWQP